MGKFANRLPDGAPQWIAAEPMPQNEPWHGESGDAALGHQVPAFRKSAAYRHLQAMGFHDKSLALKIVGVMSERIARDDPHYALEEAHKLGLDVTGCYVIMAELLAAPEPPPPPEPDATYVDLVQA